MRKKGSPDKCFRDAEARRVAVAMAKFVVEEDWAAADDTWNTTDPEKHPCVIYWLATLPGAIADSAGQDPKKMLETMLRIYGKYDH